MTTPGKYISNSVSWLNVPLKKKTKSGKRERKKKIVNPIFLEAKKYTDDPFWQELLNKAALNKFPRKITLESDYLYLTGARENKVIIPTDARKAAEVFIAFLKETKGLSSERDRERSLEEQNNQELEKYLVDWSNWKKIPGKQKEFLLEQYILHLSEDMKLSSEQTDQLRKIIAIGKTLKCFDVSLGHGFIESIDGLIYDEDNELFDIDETKIKKASKNKTRRTKTTTYRRPTITIESSFCG